MASRKSTANNDAERELQVDDIIKRINRLADEAARLAGELAKRAEATAATATARPRPRKARKK